MSLLDKNRYFFTPKCILCPVWGDPIGFWLSSLASEN